MIVEKLKDPSKKEKYLPFLKEIVEYTYKGIREYRAKELALPAQLRLPYTFEEKNRRNEITKYIIANCKRFYISKDKSLQQSIIEELEKEGIDASIAIQTINYYCGVTNVDNPKEVQKNIGKLVKTATRIINENQLLDTYGNPIDEKTIERALDGEYKLKRVYYVDEPSIDLYQLLLNININLIKNNLLQNEEMYQLLLDIMTKKKLHALPEELKGLIKECRISDDYTNIASFINFFVPILESERKRLASIGKRPEDALTGLASILTRAETYSSLSSVYSQILGDTDAKLIKANPGPNSAHNKIENNGRLKEAVELTMQNFKRQQITIPPFDETFTLNDDKKLNVIVGNFTDPSNLTHGERTGACMRIGGVGETLFQFCLTNPNGFHIRFEDPETHEYISRVSGFRNGNTIFLNELRYSCNPDKYTDMDIVEACKKAAVRLIELSKDSPAPIENVVIAYQYAMTKSIETTVPFHIKDNKEGLPKFYSDVGSDGVVLATTAKDSPIVPIDFDKSKVPTYQPVRPKIRFLRESPELIGRINRVASIKAVLNGTNYEDLDSLHFEDGILYGIVSDDWYVYLDESGNIMGDYIDIDPRAKEEFLVHIEKLEQMISKDEIRRETYAL